MSGIYIKGMEMPKSCDECCCMNPYYGCAFIGAVGGVYGKRSKDCPLISVPDHGNLIDRDMVLKKAWDVETFVDAVRFAPTIIPADKDGAE